MRLEIRWKGMQASTALARDIRHRVDLALGRFAGTLRRVVVRLEDTNGPKGGVDKRCTVRTLGELGEQVVERQDSDVGVAVDRALDRMARATARAIRFRRSYRRTA